MAPIPIAAQSATSIHSKIQELSSRTISSLLQSTSEARRIASSLIKRQSIVAIPLSYQIPSNNPSPGTVVGIVLGVVLGLGFILWITYTVFNIAGREDETKVEIITKRPRKSRHSARSERSARSEVIEVSRSRPRSSPRRTREIVVEEVRRPAPPPQDDIVEVIEEHSPERRPRRSSGYRNVDPGEFGGGRRDRRGVR